MPNPAPDACPHGQPALRREGNTLTCFDCGASVTVPRCWTCRAKTCEGCDDPRCTTCVGKLTTWIVRGVHLVCYKCNTAVPGLEARHALERTA